MCATLVTQSGFNVYQNETSVEQPKIHYVSPSDGIIQSSSKDIIIQTPEKKKRGRPAGGGEKNKKKKDDSDNNVE